MEKISQDTANPSPDTPRIQPDWDRIRREYLTGASPTALAKAHGVNLNTLKMRIMRGAWAIQRKLGKPSAKKLAKALINHHLEAARDTVSEQAKQAVKEWQEASIGIAGRIRDEVQARVLPTVETKELEVLAKTLDVTDKVGRRSYGLDSPDQQSGTRDVRSVIGIRLELVGNPVPSDPITIDAVSEPV